MKCRVCQSNKLKFYAKKEKHSFYTCKNCKVVQQEHVNSKEIINYYKKEYYKDKNKIENFFTKFNSIKFNNLLTIISNYTKGKSILDVGSGYGLFVKIATKRGFKCDGLEPNIASVKIAKQHGIKLTNKFLENTKKTKKYDIINAHHVIEHVIDPNVFLDRIIERLNNKGLLVIETPNIQSINSKRMKENWPFLIPNEHLHYFSKENLSKMLQDRGMKIVTVKSTGPFLHMDEGKLKQISRKKKVTKLTIIIKKIYDFMSSYFGLGDHVLIIGMKK